MTFVLDLAPAEPFSSSQILLAGVGLCKAEVFRSFHYFTAKLWQALFQSGVAEVLQAV